ncbi:MAG: GYD domain-containing protein [Thermoguttaceae bacterium]
MATFLMFGKYSVQAIKEISSERTDAAVDLIERFGGEVQAMYATLGPNDLVFIVNFPGVEEAMKASVALSRMSGIAFQTSPVVTVERFDELMQDL